MLLLSFVRLVLHRTYRGLYILNWIYRYMTEVHYKQYIGEC